MALGAILSELVMVRIAMTIRAMNKRDPGEHLEFLSVFFGYPVALDAFHHPVFAV